MKRVKYLLSTAVMIILFYTTAFASGGLGLELYQTNIPAGNTGSNINIGFKIKTDENWDSTQNLYLSIPVGSAENIYYDEATPSVYDGMPFEFTGEQENYGFTQRIGKVSKNSERTVTFTLRIRRDIPEGYYLFDAYVCSGDEISANSMNGDPVQLKIWVRKGTATVQSEEKDTQRVTFELGENQTTPYAVYPEICNFALNLRNSGTMTAMDVTASIVCEADSEKFPFDINETNYNRHFEYITHGETVSLPYSFAIRSNTYTGYYPIKMVITYRESSGSELKKEEKTFFVHIKNKDKEAEKKQNEFNANDRVKARIIIDSYRTEPADVYAGTDYTLYVTFKNASKSVDASNVLLTFDSEKVSESPVFTTSGGSNSVVIETLKAEESAEVSMHFTAGASVDQRSYAINVSEKYDSPEFKNAEEKVSLTVPVLQVAKFNMGNVEVMPSSISVGEESNVMFAINNTGKVILYNVMVKFEDASISTTESYIGNIKPGSSANVDAMISGVAPTTGDGHIKTSISYEDEYGNLTVTDKDVILYVNEAFEMPENFDIPVEIPVEEPWYQKKYVKWGGAGAVLLLAIVIFLRRRKKKKEF